MGYHRAGYDVVGVDIVQQPRYPFRFIQADAIDFVSRNWKHFDFVHGSPPCQEYTPLHALHPHKTYPDHIAALRHALSATGLPYVIENVMSAPLDKARSIVLCGEMFGLRTIRHRRFEFSSGLTLAAPRHPKSGEVVDGMRCDRSGHRCRTATKRRRELWDQGWHVSITGDVGTYVGPEAMGINWMTGDELCEAVPPAYTEYIGTRLVLAK